MGAVEPVELDTSLEDHLDELLVVARRVAAAVARRLTWLEPEELEAQALEIAVRAARAYDPELDGADDFAGYVGRRVRWGLIDHARHPSNRARRVEALDAPAPWADPGSPALVDAIAAPAEAPLETRVTVRAAVDRLSRRERQVLFLTAYRGLSCRESARRLGVDVHYLRRIRRHALRRLRMCLEQSEELTRVGAPVALAAEECGSEVALTDRERAVLAAAAAGLTNEETARRYGLGSETIKTYRKALIAKFGARNITHAVYLAMALGLLGHPSDAGLLTV